MWNSIRLKVCEEDQHAKLSKALHISSATFRVAPHLLKAPAALSDTNVRRRPVDQENHTGNQKKGQISLGD